MKNVLRKIVKRRCEFIIEEENVTEILKVIYQHISESAKIGNCGWGDQPTKWFVVFYTTEDVWVELKTTLKNGNFKEIQEVLKDSFGTEVFHTI